MSHGEVTKNAQQVLRKSQHCVGWRVQGVVSGLQIGVAGALLLGCGVASTTLWYYSRRYVGELALYRSRPGTATFSVLDFWGNRQVRAVTEVYRRDRLPLASLDQNHAGVEGSQIKFG